ncbi:MAG: alkaline phosphatase family protein [Candidatus Bipolaricaulia bacterium]
MAIFRRAHKKKRLFLLGIDGVPYEFANRQIEAGNWPHFERLLGDGRWGEMRSSIPDVSSVAWSTVVTGVNPGKHAIYGFQDRKGHSYETFIPLADYRKAPALWDLLGQAGKRSVVINVPLTFPVNEINGVMIGGFLTYDLSRGVHPRSLLSKLEEIGYQVDVDSHKAQTDKDGLLKDLYLTLEKRLETILYLMQQENWDFFMAVIMGTDRINHFLFEEMETGHEVYAPAFVDYYRAVDEAIGRIADRLDLDDNTTFIVMSDHGFQALHQEIHLNHWLKRNGWLAYRADDPKKLEDLSPNTKAFSMTPGRIYFNIRGREPNGCVEPEDLPKLKEELSAALKEIELDGEPIIEAVHDGSELYRGPYAGYGPDLVALPRPGYDLKEGIGKREFTYKGGRTGMHRHDGALLYINEDRELRDDLWVADLTPTILERLDLEVPSDLDGRGI